MVRCNKLSTKKRHFVEGMSTRGNVSQGLLNAINDNSSPLDRDSLGNVSFDLCHADLD